MSIRDLQKLKKREVVPVTVEKVETVIVGNDFWSASAFLKLNNNSVKIINERPFVREDFKLIGPNGLRGEKSPGQNYLKVVPIFYKDQEFKKFNGRSRPQQFMPGEAFYSLDEWIWQGASVPTADFLGPLTFNDQIDLERLNGHLILGQIISISKESSDRNRSWLILLGNGHQICCQNLIWGRSPKLFLEKFTPKSHLSLPLIQYIESTQAPSVLQVRFTLKKMIDERLETFFIPLSMTHELGHFIGQFKRGESEGEQILDFVHFIDPEQVDEEQLSRNVKNLRKLIEKIFPAFEKNVKQEFIRLSDSGTSSKIDDDAFKAAKESEIDLNLCFIGENSPMTGNSSCEDFGMEAGFMVRACQSLHSLNLCPAVVE